MRRRTMTPNAHAKPVDRRDLPDGHRLALGVARACSRRQAAAQAKSRREAPRFEVDPLWPKPLPNHWMLGIDHRRRRGLPGSRLDHSSRRGHAGSTKERGALATPPAGECCAAAPPVLEFDQAGNLLQPLGRPGQGLRVAGVEPRHHRRRQGQRLDRRQRRDSDAHILKFTRDGKFLKQFGFQYASAGSNDLWAFGRVAKIFVDEPTNEAYIADGYGNKRVAVIDAGHREDQALLGRLRQQAGRHQPRPLQPDRAAGAAVPQPGALRRAVERRLRLRLRSRERPHPGLHEGRARS